MIWGEQIVWNIRTTVDIGEHSQWGRIDDDGVLFHRLRSDFFVGDAVIFRFTGNQRGADTQLFQSVEDSFLCASRPQDQGFAMCLV